MLLLWCCSDAHGLKADWIILYSNNTEKDYRTPEHACPALRYDPERGDYYLTGGGEVQQGQLLLSTPQTILVRIVQFLFAATMLYAVRGGTRETVLIG